MFVTRSLFLTWLWVACSGQWMTEYDQHFKLECPGQEVIKSLDSMHDNNHEDRVWNMTCAAPPNQIRIGVCEWTGFINDHDELFEFQCPEEMVIAGMEGIRNNATKDRQFSFKCCVPTDAVAHSCMDTPYVNDYDQMFNYRVPDGYVFRGVNSQYDYTQKDRIFKFDICKIDNITIVGR